MGSFGKQSVKLSNPTLLTSHRFYVLCSKFINLSASFHSEKSNHGPFCYMRSNQKLTLSLQKQKELFQHCIPERGWSKRPLAQIRQYTLIAKCDSVQRFQRLITFATSLDPAERILHEPLSICSAYIHTVTWKIQKMQKSAVPVPSLCIGSSSSFPSLGKN